MLAMQPKVTIGAPFELIDHFGRTVTERSFGDKFKLIFFGFTHCRRVCPERLGELSKALADLGPLADKLQALYISVDPVRDTPERMRTFLEANFPRFLGLTGDEHVLADVRSAYKIYAQRSSEPLPDGGYDVPHTALTFVMDPEGKYVAHLSDGAGGAEMAERLSKILS